MPPSEPVQELIMRDVVTRLQQIRQGDTYWNNVERVERVSIDPRQTSGIVLVVVSPSYVAKEMQGGSNGQGLLRRIMQVEVWAFWTADSASDTGAQRLCADIEKAICTDRFCGGNARNTTHTGRIATQDEAQEPFAQLRMQFDITFDTEFASPEVQA